MNYVIKLKIYLLFCIYAIAAVSLNAKWNGYIPARNLSFAVNVPGGIYSDLENAKLIPENLLGFNDVNNRWVGNESVVYTTEIQLNEELISASHVILTFHGLDTFATVYVNDFEVGKSSNMYLKYNFDIKEYLKKEEKNILKVVFESSVKVAEKLFEIQSKKYVVPPKCVPKEYHGECHINHIRKMPASYGWDWGPAFPSMGIWKNVTLQPVYNIFVTDIAVDVVKANCSWQIVATVFFNTLGAEYIDAVESLRIKSSLAKKYSNSSVFSNLNVVNNHANLSVTISVPFDKVELWWPNGYGKQKLYELQVDVVSGKDFIVQKKKIGFRTVELVQDRLKHGRSFYFKVNGVPIFAKGSNWIPSSIFPEKLSSKGKIQYLLKSCKEAHMNQLRVWGGGVYESDLFYDLADEYGIIIWQDFMFACNMYPATKSFLENVKEEVAQNVKRLKHHPSIVLWAGNNENEAVLFDNWYNTSKQRYKDDYAKLYVDTIKHEVSMLDSTRPYLLSSPTNGVQNEEKNQTSPYSSLYGDVHYYNYDSNGWDVRYYPIPRFSSEYGFQALPSIWTWLSATQNLSDLKLNSSFLEHRQHLRSGFKYMSKQISHNFIIPKSNNSLQDLLDYIYLSQITQAVSIRVQTESYRQMKSLFNDKGEGMTMGALYWQLNDVWQAPSWSSIDFEGRWKMLHYYAKEFYAPVIVTSRLNGTELGIYIVSDLLQNFTDLNIDVVFYEWKRSKSIYTVQIKNITMGPNESKLIAKYKINEILKEAGCGAGKSRRKHCLIELVLKNGSDIKIAPENYVYLHPLKKVDLPDDALTVNISLNSTTSKSNFVIEITSKNIALFVWLEMSNNVVGRFSKNGFHILHNKETINFETDEPTTLEDIKKNLIIISLSKIYNSRERASDLKLVVDQFVK